MTVNQLTWFTVQGHWYDVENPPLTSGSVITPTVEVISAFVTFTPRLAPGQVEYLQNLDLGVTLPPPVLSATHSATGGTFAAGTYYGALTAVNANGETTKSNDVTSVLTGTTSSITYTWPAVDLATSYKYYRGTTSSEDHLIATISAPTLTYTDTGTAGSAGTPPSTNTAEASANTALAIAPITARILQGELQTIDQDDTPKVQLLANTAVLGLSTLIYDVSFTNVVYAGAAQPLNNFAFTAPTSATTIDLSDPTLTRLAYNPSGYS